MLAEFDARNTQIEAMGREIDTASKHIEHVTATLARTHEEVRARAVDAEELRRSLEQRTVELADTRAAARAELEARSAHIAALIEALDRRAAETVRWRTAVDGLTRQIEGFERSLSWRWTAPARALLRMFKRS
jgi:uncharacterized protein involved in exopolysaccharide biosynthesis